MSSFTKSPPLKLSPDGEMWTVAEDFEYHIGSEDSGEVVKVPKGFMSDGASIPKIFWSLIGGPTGKYFYAAILHDYLYYTKIYKRCKADKIFYEAMGVLGVPNWKRSIMYMAVRLAGWISWNNRKPLIVSIILLLFCMANISCAYFGKTFVIGSGSHHKEYYEDGSLKSEKKECKSPISDVVNMQVIRAD